MAEIIAKGQDFEILNLSLTATADTEVDPSASADRRGNAFIIQCRTAVDILLRLTDGETQYFTIKSGTVFHLDLSSAREKPFYLRSGNGSVTAEVLVLY